MNRKAELLLKLFVHSPLTWVIFFLQIIGRLTYKSAFFILKWAYIFVYTCVSLVEHGFYISRWKHIGNVRFVFRRWARNFLVDIFSDALEVQKLIQRRTKIQKVDAISKSRPVRRQRAVRLTKAPYLYSVLKWVYVATYDVRAWWAGVILKITSVFTVGKRVRRKIISYAPTLPSFRLRFSLRSFLAVSIISVLLITATTGGFFYFIVLKDLPDPNQLITRERILTTKIYARDGSLLYKIYRNQNRSVIALDEIPDNVVNATIAMEDKSYWSHPGFSVRGISRAIKNNLNHDTTQGGSTITQQLVKNALLSPERTYVRKLRELILAIQVEMNFSKQEILQMYFNEVPYGGVAYGVEEASQTYFGKSVRDLNLSESALLAGLTSAPTKYSPHGTNPEYAVYRQQMVLKRMLEDEYITAKEYRDALRTKVTIKPPISEIKAPHFTMYVKDQLVEMFGTRLVEEGGLEVYTTLDPEIQASAEKAVSEEVEKLIPMRVTNGAAVVTNPQSGEVLAMVGSRDFFDTQHDGNVNVTMQLRQPGSSIKPVTYALALQSGMTPSSMIEDSPVAYPDGFDDWGRPRMYKPVNYDNTFHGKVNLKTALASSFNIPAVKLVDKFGVDNMIDLAEKLGISTWDDRNRFGLSITLGGGEVKMTDMAVVYGVFANQGLRVNLQSILQVKDSHGKILYDFTCDPNIEFLPEAEAKGTTGTSNTYCHPKSVMSPFVAYQITDMLSDNNARIPAFGPNSLLRIDGHQVAVKTGTTNDKRDNWAVGYTPDRVVVVWVGNNDNTPMSAVASGITGATPIWHNIMQDIVDDENFPVVFEPPNGLVEVEICATNGFLPCASCPSIKKEYFIPGTEPKLHCVDEDTSNTKPEEHRI